MRPGKAVASEVQALHVTWPVVACAMEFFLKKGGEAMALKINEECVACGACEPECPNEAISEGDPLFVIDPDKCTECYGFHSEQQCAVVCPTEACVLDPDHTESKEDLLKKFQASHPGENPENTDSWNPPAK